MKTLTLVAALTLSPLAFANPFPDADPHEGKLLHAENCVVCHERNFGGEEASAIYLRPDRKVQSIRALKSQITLCTTQLGLDLFPEDEANIGAYLNATYYQFEAP